MASVIQLLELVTIGAYSPAFKFEAGESSNAPVSRAVRTSHRCRRPGASQTCVLTEVASDDAIAGQIAVAASTGGFAAAVQAFQVSLSNGHIPDSRDVAVLVESAALSGQGSRCWDVAITVAVAGVQQGLSISQAKDMCLCLRVVCACMLALAGEGRPDAIQSLWACFLSASQERERAERATAGIGGGGGAWAAGAASFSSSAAGSGQSAAGLGSDLPAPLLEEHGQPRVDPWEHALGVYHCALGLACGRAGVPGATGAGKTKEAAGSAAPASAASVVSLLKQTLASSLRAGLGVHPLSCAGLVLAETHAGSKQGAREGMRVLMAEAGEGMSGDRLLPLLIAASASSLTADLRAAVEGVTRAAHAPHAQGPANGSSGRVASDVAQARVGEQAGYALHAHAWLAAAYSRSDEPLVESILHQLHVGHAMSPSPSTSSMSTTRGRTGEATVSLKDAQLGDICSWLSRGSVPMRGTAASSPASLLPSLLLPAPGRPLSALQQPTHCGANLRAAYLCSAEGGSGAGLGKALGEFLGGPGGPDGQGGKYRLLPETLSLFLATLAQLAGWSSSSSTNKGAVRTNRAGDNVCILPAHLLPDLPPTPTAAQGEGSEGPGAVVLIKDSASYVALIQAILACARSWGVRPRPVDIAAIVLIHGACGNIRLAMADIRASAAPLPGASGGAHPLAHPLYASLLLGMAKCQPGCVTKLDLEWVATRAGEDGVLGEQGQAQGGRPHAALALAVGSLAQALAAGGSGPELSAHAYTVFRVSPSDVAAAAVAQGGGQPYEEGVGGKGGEGSAELQLAAVQSRSLPFLRLPSPCTAVASVLSRILGLRAPLLLEGAGTGTGTATTLSSPALAVLADLLITGARREEGGAQSMPLIFQSGQSVGRSPLPAVAAGGGAPRAPPHSTTTATSARAGQGSPGKERREKEVQQDNMDLMPSLPGFAVFGPSASSLPVAAREAAGSTPNRARAASPPADGGRGALIPHAASSSSSLMGSPAPRLLSPGLWKAPARDIAQAVGSKGGSERDDTAHATTTTPSRGPQLSHEIYGSSTHLSHALPSRRQQGEEEKEEGSEQVPLSVLPSGVIATLRPSSSSSLTALGSVPSSSLTALGSVPAPDARAYGGGKGLTGTSSSSPFAVPSVPELLAQDVWRVPVAPTPYDGHRSALASSAPSVLLDPASVSGQGLYMALATAPPTLEVAPQGQRKGGGAVDSRDAALARAALPTAASVLRGPGDSLTSSTPAATGRGVSAETLVLEEGVRAIHADSARLEAQLHALGSAAGVAETELKGALAALQEARAWMGLEAARVLVKREEAGGKGAAALEDVQAEGALALAAPAKPAVSAYLSAGSGGSGGTAGKGRRGGATEGGQHDAASSVLAIRAIDAAPAVRARESALRAALLSLQAEESSLLARLHASPLAHDLYQGYTDAVRTLSTTAAALQEGAAADDEAVMRLEDSVYSTRQGLRAWALGGGGAPPPRAEGKEAEQPGALPPALADALVQLSSTLLSDTVRQVRRARASVREGVSGLMEAGRAGVEALSALAAEQEKVNAGLKAVIGEREAEVQAVQAVLSQCQEEEEHAQLALLSLSQHAARAASAHAAEHDRIEAALSRVRTSLARALSARVQDVQTDVASALEAAARKGRAAAAAEGSEALQAARTAAEAAVSAAWDEMAASLGPEQHAAAAQEARERLAGLEGQMEAAVGAASRAASLRREMAARAKAEAQLLAQAQAELEASRAGTTAAHGILASVTGAPHKSTLGLKPAVPWDTISSMLLHPAQELGELGHGAGGGGGLDSASSAIPAQEVIDTLEGALLEHTERGMARLGERVSAARGGEGKEGEGEEPLPSHLTTTSLSLSTLLQLYEEEAQRIHKALHRTPRLNMGLGGGRGGVRHEGLGLASPPPSSASSVIAHGGGRGPGRERGGLPTSYDLASPPREYAMDSPGDLERMLLGALHSAKAGARASQHHHAHAASLLAGQAQPPLTSPSAPSPAVQGYAAIAARKRESSKGRSLSPTSPSAGAGGVRAYSSYGPARAPVLPPPGPHGGGKLALTPLEALAASEHL